MVKSLRLWHRADLGSAIFGQVKLFKVRFIFRKRGNGSGTFLIGLLKAMHLPMYRACSAQHLGQAGSSGGS